MDHSPDRMQGLIKMRLPEYAGELHQIIHAVSWMRTALSNLVEVVHAMPGRKDQCEPAYTSAICKPILCWSQSLDLNAW